MVHVFYVRHVLVRKRLQQLEHQRQPLSEPGTLLHFPCRLRVCEFFILDSRYTPSLYKIRKFRSLIGRADYMFNDVFHKHLHFQPLAFVDSRFSNFSRRKLHQGSQLLVCLCFLLLIFLMVMNENVSFLNF